MKRPWFVEVGFQCVYVRCELCIHANDHFNGPTADAKDRDDASEVTLLRQVRLAHLKLGGVCVALTFCQVHGLPMGVISFCCGSGGRQANGGIGGGNWFYLIAARWP